MKPLHRTAAASLFAIAATITFPVAAHPTDFRISARQANQAHRIADGVATGALTARETARLLAEQRAIRAKERYYKSDGVLTPFERADLNRDLAFASRDIRVQKHDGQRQF